jgi:hypothetical protein
MGKTLFHYTPVVRAVVILRDGVINRSTGKTPPYVWLSSNPTNEPTANRVPLNPEWFHQCDARAFNALERQARFVFHGYAATPWAALRLSSVTCRNLERKAKDKGSRPEDWFTLPDAVPCRGLPLEIETLEGRWQEIERDELKRRYEDLEVMFDGNRIAYFRMGRR